MDFLTHLVARSFDLGPRLQRRVPSLFEPAAGAGAPGATEPPPPHDAPRGRESLMPPAPPSRSGEPRSTASFPATREESPPLHAALPSRSDASLQPIAIEAGRTDDHGADAAPASRARRNESPLTAEDRGEATSSSNAREDGSSAGDGVVADRSRVLERLLVRETRVDHTVLAPPAAGRSTEAGVSVRAPRGADSAWSRRQRVPAADAAAPAPTISVTIGRVEVRASRAAGAPARARREAAPRLNLDEYLRRRSGRSDE